MDMDRPLKVTSEYAMQSGRSLDQDEWLASKRAGETDESAATESRARFSAVAQLTLSRWRFAVTITISLAVLVALLTLFVHGVVIDKNVKDELGSTKEVDGKIEKYQVMNGYVTAAVGLIMESYFEVFIVVAVTFLSNVRWYPGDEPRTGGNRFKRFCLWGFPPWIMFILNVAIAATFVSHKTTGFERVFLKDDLFVSKAFSAATLNATSAANLTSLGNKRSVLDTILRGAVRRQVAPFEMLTDSPCVLANVSATDAPVDLAELPSVKEVRATAVVYGFPLQDWNLDAMPFGLVPQHTFEAKLGDVNASESDLTTRFDAFQKASKLSWLTTYEMLLQGKLLFERSVSDSDVTASYPCDFVENYELFESVEEEESGSGSDGTDDGAEVGVDATSKSSTSAKKKLLAQRRVLQTSSGSTAIEGEDFEEGSGEEDFEEEDLGELDSEVDVFEEGPYKGLRRCYGAVSSLQRLANMTDPSMHSITAFVKTMVQGFVDTVPQVEPEAMDLTISTYTISPQLQLTAMTLDMPYFQNTPYRNTSDNCDGEVLKPELEKALKEAFGEDSTDEDIAEWTRVLCDQTSYPYMTPRDACGHSNCIFLDKSRTIPFKKQLQLTPFLTNCSAATLKYSADYRNFFPTGCVPQQDAVFLYGLGSYMAGESFDMGDNESFPFIDNPRRHIVVSFAKLEWKTDELHTKFQAECHGANGTAVNCKGLLYNLENVTEPALNMSGLTEKRVRMLVLGEDHLPAERMDKDFRDPVQLVSLNTRPFYYRKDDDYYEWEYIDKRRFKENTWPNATTTVNGKPVAGLSAAQCSPLVDSYIAQVETNHFYIDNPLQPLYTSALFYLFQDASVKTVKVTRNITTGVEALELSVVGTTSLKGDQEKHVIKFSIPLASALSTFAGMGFLLLLVVLVLVCPTERLKKDEETNVAVQFAQLLQHDQYPSEVFERTLLLPSGERVAMDEYVVESATVHFTRDADKKVFL